MFRIVRATSYTAPVYMSPTNNSSLALTWPQELSLTVRKMGWSSGTVPGSCWDPRLACLFAAWRGWGSILLVVFF
jgi:hypothetical protein